ncbi:hypothetical protein B0H14DRAFT_2658417 [Mycena olivaceomarginata]|nr:hypothetical protein B0H14DRAFT_2658417 [Mycena olivaceomarginata]
MVGKSENSGCPWDQYATAVEFPALFTAFECKKFLEFVFHTQGHGLRRALSRQAQGEKIQAACSTSVEKKGNGEEKSQNKKKRASQRTSHRALMTRLPMAIEEEVMRRREPCTDENQYSNGNERKEGRRVFQT